MSAASNGLIYVSLSEARIACFRHHLDEKPLFHLTIAKALNLTGIYLTIIIIKSSPNVLFHFMGAVQFSLGCFVHTILLY